MKSKDFKRTNSIMIMKKMQRKKEKLIQNEK